MSTPILIYNGSPEPIGEVFEDESGWIALHYKMDVCFDCIKDKEDAIQTVIDIEQGNV